MSGGPYGPRGVLSHFEGGLGGGGGVIFVGQQKRLISTKKAMVHNYMELEKLDHHYHCYHNLRL